MARDKARGRSQSLRRPIVLAGAALVFGLVVAAIWFFGNDHQALELNDLPLPPPQRVEVNAQGVQELVLVITPDGYNPIHFAVTKRVPVKLTFRQFGQVGCGNTLIFPIAPGKTSALTLESSTDRQVLEFTPPEPGQFQFSCPHNAFRGSMTVTE